MHLPALRTKEKDLLKQLVDFLVPCYVIRNKVDQDMVFHDTSDPLSTASNGAIVTPVMLLFHRHRGRAAPPLGLPATLLTASVKRNRLSRSTWTTTTYHAKNMPGEYQEILKNLENPWKSKDDVWRQLIESPFRVY